MPKQSFTPDRVFYPHFPTANAPEATITDQAEIQKYGRLLASRLFNEALNHDATKADPTLPPPKGASPKILEIKSIVESYDKDGVGDGRDLMQTLKSGWLPELPQNANATDVYHMWASALMIFDQVFDAFDIDLAEYDNALPKDKDGPAQFGKVFHQMSYPAT